MLIFVEATPEKQFFFGPTPSSVMSGAFVVDPYLTIKHNYVALKSRRVGLSATIIHVYIRIPDTDKTPYNDATILPALKHLIKCHDILFPFSPIVFLNVSGSTKLKHNLMQIYPFGTPAYRYHISTSWTSYPWTVLHHYQRVFPPNTSRRRAFFLKTYHYPF